MTIDIERIAAEVAAKLADNGSHRRLGAAFRCTFMMRPAERMFPADFLTFKANGIVEDYAGAKGPQLTALGLRVRAHLEQHHA